MKNRFFLLTLITISVGMAGQKISIDPEIRMLVLGDSYSIGESVEEKQRWPEQFVSALRELGIEANEPDYIATTGWTTTQLIQGIDIYLNREKQYNLVSILIGVNNQYQGIDISTYEPELKKIINLALDIVDQDAACVFILSIPDYAYTPFGEGKPSISQEIDAYNAIKKKLAREYNISFVDITPISRTGLSNPSLVAGDGLHPSSLQYSEWVQKILPQIAINSF